jgi:hypothetical protein
MPLPGMDRPPLPGPDIQSQMGMSQEPPREAGLSGIKPMGQVGPAPGAPNPHGFLMAQIDAIKKVLEQIASAEPIFASFAQKAQSILDTGLSAVSAAPKPGMPGQGPAEAGTGGPPPPLPSGGGSGTPPLG